MRKLIAFVVTLQLAASAYAVGSHSLKSNGKVGTFGGLDAYSFDLVAVVETGDDWTSTAMKATITPAATDKMYYQDALGSSGPPNPLFFPVFPSLQWDSFYTTPESYPNTASQGAAPGFAAGPADTAKELSATWFDTPNTGGGNWVIARLTILSDPARPALTLDPTPDVVADITGTTTFKATGGQLIPFSFKIYQVPEPTTLSLLALGGLAGLIRRR